MGKAGDVNKRRSEPCCRYIRLILAQRIHIFASVKADTYAAAQKFSSVAIARAQVPYNHANVYNLST